MAIRFFDMFAGIGGFRSGLEAIGGFECVGHCEIDKYANQAYNAIYNPKPQEVFFEDATKINPHDVPDIDLICGGFPCQAFSIAGKRGGFEDARGTLFFEIARIAAVKRPKYLFLENVPGLLSHDRGRTFATILMSLSDLGYDVTWQVLNSKDFGVPQSRKRVYIIGYLRERCSGEILSFHETNAKALMQILPGREGDRVYSPEGVAVTLTSSAGGFGGKTGLYDVNLPIKVRTKRGYQLAYPGDSIDLAYLTQNSRRGRVGDKIAHTVTPGNTQGYFFIDMNPPLNLTEIARCITARQDSGISKRKGEHSGVFIEEKSNDKLSFIDLNEDARLTEHARCLNTRQDLCSTNHKGQNSGVFVEDEPRAILTPDKEVVRQNGRRVKEPNEPMFTLTVCDRHGIIRYGKVRRLMPIECWRLQGFTDEQFHKAEATGLKDGRLYKMAGNAVSVPVISAVGMVIKTIDERQ
jgi:DNA (cytosine-5)-methyltransferase 1